MLNIEKMMIDFVIIVKTEICSYKWININSDVFLFTIKNDFCLYKFENESIQKIQNENYFGKSLIKIRKLGTAENDSV